MPLTIKRIHCKVAVIPFNLQSIITGLLTKLCLSLVTTYVLFIVVAF